MAMASVVVVIVKLHKEGCGEGRLRRIMKGISSLSHFPVHKKSSHTGVEIASLLSCASIL